MKGPFEELVDALTPRPPVRAAWWGWALAVALAVAIVATLAAITEAYAQERPRVVIDCNGLASTILLVAWARDMRADENLVAIYFGKANTHLGHNVVRAIDREIRRVWKERLKSSAAVQAAFQRCQAQLGDMGMEG